MTQTTNPTTPVERIVFLDFIRVASIFMVVLAHCFNPYYETIKEGNFFWLNTIVSAMRPSVPLFVMVSSFLLLPLKCEPGDFYRRRFTRILIPFAVWSVLYATLPYLWGDMTIEQVKKELLTLTYNFNMRAEHLWFMYMFIGVYLIMPVISPWLATTSKKFEQVFIGIWFLTTFYHYAKLLVPQFWGECVWNEFTPIWYFSGYIGFVVLAHYIRTHLNWTVKKNIIVGVLLFLVGYVSTWLIFHHFASTSTKFADWELGWRFCTPNVALMAAGLFVIMKQVKINGARSKAFFAELSKMSFGIFLIHELMLYHLHNWIEPITKFIPLTGFVNGVITFTISYLIVKAISYLPKSKYIIG